MTTFILNFRCKSLEEWEKSNEVIGDRGIAIIDYPDGHRKVVIGDGKTKCLDCKELKKFPKSIKLVAKRWVSSHHLNAVAKIDEDELKNN